MKEDGKYYEKFRGSVISNIDPEFRGRLLVSVPDVLSLLPPTGAEPCIRRAGPRGPGMGSYFVPPIGAGLWVEFEYGDPSRPIWVGCRWGQSAPVPPLAMTGLPTSPNIVLQTLGQNSLVVSDLPGPTGGIMLKSASGGTPIVNDTSIR